jgi:hypothetical protein
MKQESLVQNPFMMMLSPESVIAAMERSEKLGRLNRRMCHPLDRQAAPDSDGEAATADSDTRPHGRDD